MAVRALVLGISAVLNASDEMTLKVGTIFWNTAGGGPEQADVDVEVNPEGTMLAWNDAMTDAIVAFASSEYSWTLPRNNLVLIQMVRGLIV